MKRSRPAFRPSATRRACWPRVLVALWLAWALLLQPAFAAACDVDDARQALAGTVQGDADRTAHAAEAADTESTQDCCSNPLCGDCCLSAAATAPSSAQWIALRLPGALSERTRTAFRVRAPSVDIRPPIPG